MIRDSSKAAAAWWTALQPDPARKYPGDRAALAQLRRCATVSEAMQEPAAIKLFQAVKASDPRELPDIALTAAILARVREDTGRSAAALTVARIIGPELGGKPETALVKPLRFRRLMEAHEPDERLIAFRRLVALAGGKLPVAQFARSLLAWNDDTRRKWIFDYWNAGQAAERLTEHAAS